MPGGGTSAAEVTHVWRHGFWLLLSEEELCVPFAHFPWFRGATIEQLTTVEWPSPDHLYWPALDVDLSVASIRDPASFPLISREHAAGRASDSVSAMFADVPDRLTIAGDVDTPTTKE